MSGNLSKWSCFDAFESAELLLVSLTDFEEFQTLLGKQSPIEAYTEWLDDIIDKCVLQVQNKKYEYGPWHHFHGAET